MFLWAHVYSSSVVSFFDFLNFSEALMYSTMLLIGHILSSSGNASKIIGLGWNIFIVFFMTFGM